MHRANKIANDMTQQSFVAATAKSPANGSDIVIVSALRTPLTKVPLSPSLDLALSLSLSLSLARARTH